MANITFKKLVEQEYAKFRADVKEIFSIAVIETFGNPDHQDEIIPDNDIDLSLYNPQCEALAVYIIRKTKCFDFWERNVLFPKTKRSFFRTPTLPFSA